VQDYDVDYLKKPIVGSVTHIRHCVFIDIAGCFSFIVCLFILLLLIVLSNIFDLI